MALRSSVQPALTVAALVVAAAALHGVSPTTADPDGFYHIRHAWLYRTNGLFDSAFPWARFSAIRDQASDLWYGFHVLLVPFRLPQNLLNGLLAGGVAVTAASLLLLLAAFSLLRLAFPLAWLVAFAATGDVLFRLTMLRPQPLSLALAVLALALCAAPGLRHRRALRRPRGARGGVDPPGARLAAAARRRRVRGELARAPKAAGLGGGSRPSPRAPSRAGCCGRTRWGRCGSPGSSSGSSSR